MYNMWRSNRWRHATKPDNGRERYSIGMVHPSIVCLSVTCVNVTQGLNFLPMFCTIYSSKIWTVRIKILGKNSEFHEIVQVKYNGVWTRSSAVAKRPRDAPCLYSFYTLEQCGYPMVKKVRTLCLFVLTWSTNVKKSPFSRTAAHIFVSPGDAPATITHFVAWMERQFNACQTPRSM